MTQDMENLIGFTLHDVQSIRALAIHYGEAASEHHSDANHLWNALFNLIIKLEEDLKKQLSQK